MSYSRKQLYAMGEPFGESATRHKLGGRIYGGGSSAPSTTTQISELPEWARGYAKESLGKAAALTDTSQNPYQAYNAPRIAGFSPLQQQAQQQAAGMTAAPQMAAATGLTAEAGLRGLEARYDPTQFAAGQFGQGEAEQYMSPYMQSVVDIQKREAQRASDIGATQRGAQATAAGAFGGSRQAIMEAEAQRNLAQQKGDIQAQGSQAAFQQAQAQFNADQARRMQAQQLAEQSKQYGAGYGMQGLGIGLQGAGQLGQLGVQQFTQGMDINKLQSAYGGQQQALQQQGLSQAYQDFQNQQNYPYKQLGFMSDLIRGLPLGQQSTAQVYEAQPGMAQQLGSLGMAGLGLSKFMAGGGEVSEYADGGSVDSPDNVANIVDSLSPTQLQQALKAAQSRGDADQIDAIQNEMGLRASMSRGLASTVTPDMADRMAGGGVVAFANGGLQDTLRQLSTAGEEDIAETPAARQAGISAALPGIKAMYGESALAPMAKEISEERAAYKEKGIPAEAYFAAAEGLLKGRGLGMGLANAGVAFGKEAAKIKKENREADRLLRASQIQLATAEQQRADGQIGKAEASADRAQTLKEKGLDRKIGVLEKKATIEAGMRNADVQAASSAATREGTDFKSLARDFLAKRIEAGEPDNAATKAAAGVDAANALGRMSPAARVEAAEVKAAPGIKQKATEAVDMMLMKPGVERQRFKDLETADKAKGTDTAAAYRRMLIDREAGATAAPAAAPAGAPPVRGGVPVAAKPSMQEFMVAAKRANPGVSDADLAAYYNSKYK